MRTEFPLVGAVWGGAEGIRTPDPLDANEVRYRTAPQPPEPSTRLTGRPRPSEPDPRQPSPIAATISRQLSEQLTPSDRRTKGQVFNSCGRSAGRPVILRQGQEPGSPGGGVALHVVGGRPGGLPAGPVPLGDGEPGGRLRARRPGGRARGARRPARRGSRRACAGGPAAGGRPPRPGGGGRPGRPAAPRTTPRTRSRSPDPTSNTPASSTRFSRASESSTRRRRCRAVGTGRRRAGRARPPDDRVDLDDRRRWRSGMIQDRGGRGGPGVEPRSRTGATRDAATEQAHEAGRVDRPGAGHGAATTAPGQHPRRGRRPLHRDPLRAVVPAGERRREGEQTGRGEDGEEHRGRHPLLPPQQDQRSCQAQSKIKPM